MVLHSPVETSLVVVIETHSLAGRYGSGHALNRAQGEEPGRYRWSTKHVRILDGVPGLT